MRALLTIVLFWAASPLLAQALIDEPQPLAPLPSPSTSTTPPSTSTLPSLSRGSLVVGGAATAATGFVAGGIGAFGASLAAVAIDAPQASSAAREGAQTSFLTTLGLAFAGGAVGLAGVGMVVSGLVGE